ncbi:hypothetical protein V1226_08715 [Lachnospiraceae bacterium JLR.KK009]|nr:hypothetical protein C810_01565 [Lachnospiraceae bacterium A2]MCI8705435.1 hypothetical protein [Lachnospiraceae bacterium]MCI8883573.1 hypothetical protein [Lachnospiraceae bacterium]
MSSKTKIVVLHLKEVIYTAIFAVLGILLIILLIFMFLPDNKEKATKETMKYTAGVYTSSIQLNDNAIDVEVVVDESHINSITLVNLDESTAAMYPLMQPTLDNITQQVYEKQSLEDISYGDDSQYTSMVLLNAIQSALDKAAYIEE